MKGFFLDVSNYQPTDQLIQFGTWVSQCLDARRPRDGGVGARTLRLLRRASTTRPTELHHVNYTPAFEATMTAGLQNMLNGAVATMPFVIDTGRNGRGPLDTAAYAAAPYNQPAGVIAGLNGGNWCNAPGAGAGLRPTASTGVAAGRRVPVGQGSGGFGRLVRHRRRRAGWDYAQYDPWGVTGDAQNHFDPLWGMVDPAAGAWFPQQALELAQQAVPPLL